MSKFSLEVLEHRVFPFVRTEDPDVAATVPPHRVEDVSRALGGTGIPFAFVGQVIEGDGVRVMREGDVLHYREVRCEEDELARMWALYPRG